MVRQKTVVMRQYDRYGWKGENMGKKEGQGENRISGIGVTARLIGITMIPIIAILIILTFISAKDICVRPSTREWQEWREACSLPTISYIREILS